MGSCNQLASCKRWGVVLGACALALVFTSTSRAQDPVEKLRQALLMVSTELDPPQEFFDVRARQIETAIGEMSSIAHYRRAYLLSEWSLHPKLDPPAKGDVDPHRVKIGKLFVDILKKAAVDSDPERRVALAFLIAEMAEADQPLDRKSKGKFVRGSGDVTRSLATDANINVRRAGIYALGKITPHPEAAVKILGEALGKDELAPRRLAAFALSDLVKNAHYLRMAVTLGEKRPVGANEELATIDLSAAAAATGLTDADEFVRGYCLQTIFESAKALNDYLDSTIADPIMQVIDDPLKSTFKTMQKGNPLVLQSLSDPKFNVRLTALYALDQIGIVRAKMVKRLRDHAPEKKFSANAALASAALADPFQSMVKGEWRLVAGLLIDPDLRLRRGSISLLEQLEEELAPAELELTRALGDDDRIVRWNAARALRHIPADKVSGKAIVALAKMLNDVDPDLGAAAATTLERLGGQVAKAMGTLDPAERDAVLEAFAFSIGDGGRPGTLLRDVESRTLAMRMLGSIGGASAKHVVPKLIESLGDTDARVRRSAAETLGNFGPAAREALPALREALRDENAEVRLMAAEAILSIDTQKKL